MCAQLVHRMEGFSLCNLGNGGVGVVGGRFSVETGFSDLTLQEWKRGCLCTPNIVALGRRGSRISKTQASGYDRSGYREGGGGRVGFKDVYRRGDSGDTYRTVEREGDSERRFQTSSDGGMGKRGNSESSDGNKNVVELPGHVDTITSVGNPYVKHLVKIREKASYRNAAGCLVVVGSVPLREICEILTKEGSSELKPIKVLLVLEDTSPRADLSSWAERIVYVSESVLRKVAGVDSTQGLQGVGVLALPASFCNLEGTGDAAINWIASPRRLLVLDGIQDPGNLGTLMRTAAAFAWDGVFMLPGGCDPFNEKALRASRGASFRLPIATGCWSQLQSFANLHKMKLYAADPDQKEIWLSSNIQPDHEDPASNDVDSLAIAAGKEALCLILGSEGQGLSENAARSCERVSIPMPGDFESLNVAIAGGILLYLLNNKIPVPKVST